MAGRIAKGYGGRRRRVIAPMTRPSDRTARFEFRVWNADLANLAARLFGTGDLPAVEESTEIYIVPSRPRPFNAKIRGDALDIKRLIQTQEPLERWCVHLKATFPLSRSILREQVCSVLPIDPQELGQSSYDRMDFTRSLIEPNPELTVVALTKRRRRCEFAGCIAEFTQVRVDGRTFDTVAVESEDAKSTLAAIDRLGLTDTSNRNYQTALRQLEPLAKPSGDRSTP